MISEEYIMKRVEKWALSPNGQEKIKKITGKKYVPESKRYTTGENKELAYGEKMKEILFKKISLVIKSISIDDIIVGKPYRDKNGGVRLQISFREGSMHRASLNPHSEGIENIVLLFTQGYHAQKGVHGIWKRKDGEVEIWSRRHREPDDFLKNAVDEFNVYAEGKAVAKLEKKYLVKNTGGSLDS